MKTPPCVTCSPTSECPPTGINPKRRSNRQPRPGRRQDTPGGPPTAQLVHNCPAGPITMAGASAGPLTFVDHLQQLAAGHSQQHGGIGCADQLEHRHEPEPKIELGGRHDLQCHDPGVAGALEKRQGGRDGLPQGVRGHSDDQLAPAPAGCGTPQPEILPGGRSDRGRRRSAGWPPRSGRCNNSSPFSRSTAPNAVDSGSGSVTGGLRMIISKCLAVYRPSMPTVPSVM